MPIKLLHLGDSGSGKTGALASLASEGYNVRVLDLDNGTEVLRNLLTDPKSIYKKDSFDRVRWITVKENIAISGGKLIPRGDAWVRAMGYLADFKNAKSESGSICELGPITKWTDQDVLCIDSMTALGKAALQFILAMNGRLTQTPFQSDWMPAQSLLENLIDMLTNPAVPCNVIINCHLTYQGGDFEDREKAPGRAMLQSRGYAKTLGRALSPHIGSFFNNALLTEIQQHTGKRIMYTDTKGLVVLKNSAPLRVAKEYNIQTGLAEYFKAIRQQT